MVAADNLRLVREPGLAAVSRWAAPRSASPRAPHRSCDGRGADRPGRVRCIAHDRRVDLSLNIRLHIRPASFAADLGRSEEHTSELQSLMRISYAVFCLKKKNNHR